MIWNNKISEQTLINLKKQIGKLPKNARILDYGCGDGRYVNALRTLYPDSEVFGYDPNYEGADPRIYAGYDMLNEENYYDLIFCNNVIEHLKFPKDIITLVKFRRSLKHKGKLVINTPNYPIKRFYDMRKALIHLLKLDKKNFIYYLFDDPTHINKLSYKEFVLRIEILFPKMKVFNKKWHDKITIKAQNVKSVN